MADGDAKQVAHDGVPGAAESPGEDDERVGQVGGGDGDDAKEGQPDGGVEAGPEVDEREGQRRGKKWGWRERG